jgi:nitrite reductase (NADH) small subunit
MTAPSRPETARASVRVPLEGLALQQGKRVASPWGELALFLLSDGQPRAVLNRCPHKGGTLAEGIVCGEHVFCTQHDWKICLKDGKAAPPDVGSTPVFKASILGGDVVIEQGV